MDRRAAHVMLWTNSIGKPVSDGSLDLSHGPGVCVVQVDD